MKYWQRYIADWRGKTAALSLIENGAYSTLLDHYYTHEQPLEDDITKLYRVCSAITEEEKEAVRNIVAKYFFKGNDQKLHNKKADEEIVKYKEFCDLQRKRRAGRVNGSSAWWKSDDGIREKYEQLQLPRVLGQSLQEAKDACFEEIDRRKRATQTEH